MRPLKFLLQKEFRQILRSKSLIFTIIFGPIIQLIILPMAANYEVKNINVAIVDHDHSSYSQKLSDKIFASPYFIPVSYGNSYDKAAQLIARDKADIILEIPQHFEEDLVRD